MRALACGASLGAALVLAPASARAEDVWTSRPLAIVGHAGLGTPAGFAGVGVEWTPSRFATLAIEGGFGGAGGQVAFLPRVRLPLGPIGFSFGAGPSLGPYSWGGQGICWSGGCGSDPYHKKIWDLAVWGNLEGSIEGRIKGFVWRVYGGHGVVVNRNGFRCEARNETCSDPSEGTSIPFAGIALGGALPL